MPINERLRAGGGEASGAGLERALDLVWQRRRASIRRRIAVTVLAGAAAAATVVVTAPFAIEQLSEREPFAPAGGDLIGTYRVQVGASDDADLAGTWRITLGTGGVVTAQPPESFAAETLNPGSYTTIDGVVETNLFVHLPGCQIPGALVGRYQWSTYDDVVRFRPVDDACEPRRVLFSAPWERVR
jgi:hypothetical protein